MSVRQTARWSLLTTRRGSPSARSTRPRSIRFRGGEVDAFGVDDVIHQYKRAARELWKFCWLAGAGAGVERTAGRCATWPPKTTASTGGSGARQSIANECANRGERGKRRAHPLGRALRQALAQELVGELVGRYLPPVCLGRVEAAYCFAPRA